MVCRRHNIEEWGRSLANNREPYYQRLGKQLLADAGCPATHDSEEDSR